MADPGGFVLDTTKWPLAVVHAAKREVSDAEIEEFFGEQRAMLARGERYVEMAQTDGVHMIPPSQRRRMADFLRETDPLATQLCAGLAVVIPNAILRGGMTAIFWIFRPSYPIKAVASVAEGAAYLLEVAEASGLPLSRAAREFLSTGGHDAVA